MSRITQEQRNQYATKLKEYKGITDAIVTKEQGYLSLLAKPGPTGAGFVRIKLVETMLELTSYQLLLNTISMALLGVKNEDALGEARKSLTKGMKYVEDIVTGLVDASYSEYESNLSQIASMTYDERYALVRKLCFAIRELEEGYGSNSKWKWSFVELWGKCSAITKNLLDLKQAYLDMDLASPYRIQALSYVGLVKKLLQSTADKYREKYELVSKKTDDFRQAILYLSALRRLHVVFAERNEADELKKKIDIWTGKLDSDLKKREEESKKR